MAKKRLVIVCRYQEDLQWVNKLEDDVIIYNKGNDFPWDFPRADVENFGKESEAYVRGILEFYEKLPDYESVVFLQGDPFHHAKNLFSKLEQETDLPFLYLGDYAQSVTTNIESCIYGSSTHIIDLFWKDIVEKTPVESEKKNFNISNLTNLQYKVKLADGSFDNRINELVEIIYLCEMMKIPYKRSQYIWDCGAQYEVKTENILNKSKYWWNSLHNLIHYTSVVLNSNIIPYILERTWPLIWNHDERRSITGNFYGEGPKL